jgi:hypothetical protein
MVRIAQDNGVTAGRRIRVDTTVVETNIHHPTGQHLAGRWGSGADPPHEKDHQDRRSGQNQAARPDPEREAAAAGDRTGRTIQRPGSSGQVDAALSPFVGRNEPGGGTGKTLLRGDQGVRRSRSFLKQLALEGLRRQLDEMMPRVKQVTKRNKSFCGA